MKQKKSANKLVQDGKLRAAKGFEPVLVEAKKLSRVLAESKTAKPEAMLAASRKSLKLLREYNKLTNRYVGYLILEFYSPEEKEKVMAFGKAIAEVFKANRDNVLGRYLKGLQLGQAMQAMRDIDGISSKEQGAQGGTGALTSDRQGKMDLIADVLAGATRFFTGYQALFGSEQSAEALKKAATSKGGMFAKLRGKDLKGIVASAFKGLDIDPGILASEIAEDPSLVDRNLAVQARVFSALEGVPEMAAMARKGLKKSVGQMLAGIIGGASYAPASRSGFGMSEASKPSNGKK
jgi:hypothetical protein